MSIVALFADDATGVHRGETHRGAGEIHAWQPGPAFIYSYDTEVGSVELIGSERYPLSGRSSGNLPAGTAEVRRNFTIARDRITSLVIAR